MSAPITRSAGMRARVWVRTARGGRMAVLLIAAIAIVFPFYTMLVLAFKPKMALEFPSALVPWPLSLDGFSLLFRNSQVLRWILNSILYSTVSVVLVLIIATLAGYAFAKTRFRGREAVFWLMLAMLMVPSQVTLIPLFSMVASAGGVNSYWGLILPTLANVQIVYLMRQFIAGIPDELLEAARIDGASEWRILRSIVFPLTRPIQATCAIYVFLWHWNDFLWPLVIAKDPSMFTLNTGIASLQGMFAQTNQLMAAAVAAFIPILLIYLWGRRFITENSTSVGIK